MNPKKDIKNLRALCASLCARRVNPKTENPMKKLLLFALLGWIIFACSGPSHDLLITKVNLEDVETGKSSPKRTVTIDGNEIHTIYIKTIKPD